MGWSYPHRRLSYGIHDGAWGNWCIIMCGEDLCFDVCPFLLFSYLVLLMVCFLFVFFLFYGEGVGMIFFFMCDAED